MAKCEKCKKENGRRIEIASGQKICKKCYNRLDIAEIHGLKPISEMIKENN